jgi:hypothetical protein
MHPATKSPALIPATTRQLPLAVAAKGARIFDESCADGTAGDAFIVAPPLTSTDEELDELLVRLRATLVSMGALFPR